MATDVQDRSGGSDFEGFEDGPSQDADFGALEMFNSSAPQPTFDSSQVDASALQQLSQAVIAEDEANSRKSKRDKKHKKHKNKDKKHKRKSEGATQADDDDDHVDEAEAPEEDADPAASSQSKKKRKHSDDADGKKHKKRKSHGVEADGGHSRSSRKSRAAAVASEDAIYEAGEEEGPAQEAPVAAMDVDNPAMEAPMMAPADVESLAREAWNEHLTAEANATQTDHRDSMIENGHTDEREQASVYGLPEGPNDREVDDAAPKRSKVNKGKKAKPTFFEQPLELDEADDYDALNELPSPSAMTPKPRNRAQKASKGRKPVKPKAPKSFGGVEDDFGRGGKNGNFIQGRFSDDELNRVKMAVENFRNEHDMTQHDVNALIQAPGGTNAGDLNAQLWMRIFAECPDRHRQKIINVARKNFHNFVARGTWTPVQDAELSDLIKVNGTKWSHIAGLINRHPEDVRDRYRNYIVCGDAQRKEAWDENEEQRLTQYVIETMKGIDEMRVEQPENTMLHQKSYEELIDWQIISERMDRTRSRLQCITKWKSMNLKVHSRDQLTSKQDNSSISFRLEKARRQLADMPEAERYRFILAIQESQVGTEAKIPWARLADKTFRNKWHRSTQMLLWRRLKQSAPDWQRKPVREIAHYIVNQYNQNGEMPEIDDGMFDDEEEMGLMKLVPAPSGANANLAKKSKLKSDEYVGSEGEEDHDEEAAQNGETTEEQPEQPAAEAEMQIDPALIEAVQPLVEASSKAAPKQSRKTGRTSDDFEDVPEDEAQEDDAAAQEGGSEVDEAQLPKAKTPSKSRTAKNKSKADVAAYDDFSDSDMDDMADVPARVRA